MMKIDKNMTKNLGRTADFLNTVNGGTVHPTFKSSKESDHYRIQVSMPSVEATDLKVEINNQNLFIFQRVMIHEVFVPNLIGMFKLSPDVVIEEISAEFVNNLLTVIMPINETLGGFHRSVEIHER